MVATPLGPRRHARDIAAIRAALCGSVLLLAVTLAAIPTTAAPDVASSWDRLGTMLDRADRFLQVHEVDGVTRDPRSTQNPAEEIRLSVVAQLLAYCELYRATGEPRYREDIVDRADFLIDSFGWITTGTAFDGMLGYALMLAYDLAGRPIYLQAGEQIRLLCLGLLPGALRLNAGLMCAMCLSEYFAQMGDAACLAKSREIVDDLIPYQHADGSFPHVCPASRDLHYTAWMSMELLIVGDNVDHAPIPQLLDGARTFLADRIGADGEPAYENLCGPGEECHQAYWSQASGCPQDYDTRGWTNELGYHALVLDHFADGHCAPVMRFLLETATDGAFPDKWGYMPDPSEPIYVWASQQQSVIRTSIIVWSLARIYADRLGAPRHASSSWSGVSGHAAPGAAGGADPDAGPSAAPAVPGASTGIVCVAPTPCRGPTSLTYRLGAAAHVRGEIYDIGGRLVRVITDGVRTAGLHEERWDGTAEGGARVPAGVYIYRWSTAERSEARKLVRLE